VPTFVLSYVRGQPPTAVFALPAACLSVSAYEFLDTTIIIVTIIVVYVVVVRRFRISSASTG
jgi:hypothetical protein